MASSQTDDGSAHGEGPLPSPEGTPVRIVCHDDSFVRVFAGTFRLVETAFGFEVLDRCRQLPSHGHWLMHRSLDESFSSVTSKQSWESQIKGLPGSLESRVKGAVPCQQPLNDEHGALFRDLFDRGELVPCQTGYQVDCAT